MRRRTLVARFALVIALGVAGCGEDEGSDEVLTVSAASSLTGAFETYGEAFGGEERFSFAGSDELAAQIRSGAVPDVFASANTSLPADLFAEGLVEEPVVFISSNLVLAVPVDSAIEEFEGVAEPGVDLVVGADGVPVGDYTREVLAGLDGDLGARILANSRSEEPDVKGIVGKLATGAADAGFVYASDVAAASGDIRAIDLPAQPNVAYAVAVVSGTHNAERARGFIDGLLDGEGRDALLDAGFLEPAEG